MNIKISNRPVEVRLSKKASAQLITMKNPIYADMELFFSCMIRKRVLFTENIPDRGIKVLDKLYVGFHPVMTKSCGIDTYTDTPPLTDFPIIKPEGFIPHWIAIDFKKGKWVGEFGYV